MSLRDESQKTDSLNLRQVKIHLSISATGIKGIYYVRKDAPNKYIQILA